MSVLADSAAMPLPVAEPTATAASVRSTSWPGHWTPLGATVVGEATNFALWAPGAHAVEVCLLDDSGGSPVERRVPLREVTFDVWHGAVPGVGGGALYGFRVHGDWVPARGLRFNGAKLLIDPYARAVTGDLRYDPAVFGHHRPTLADPGDDLRRDDQDSAPFVPYSVVVDAPEPTGLRHPRPRTPWSDTVMYELHVRGFTMSHPDVPPRLRGTYAGLAHPAVLEHLTGLGVTTVELLPVHQYVSEPHLGPRGLTNYWGYNSIAFFAPHAAYSASGSRGQQVEEFRAMVQQFHRAGLEVVLDVVHNHTGEQGHDGPTLSLRGVANRATYRLRSGGRRYRDFTGCGNTVDVRHPRTLQLVLDSLRYWVEQFDVDGFRFDLATSLGRESDDFDPHGRFLSAVAQDPVLRDVKLVAEPWDLGWGGYQVGGFPYLWTEWNGRYRDTVRDFWRGATPGVRDLAYRLSGSSDLYRDDGRHPYASVNLVTAHDGFTLRDLVSYDRKHNAANGEDGRDGEDHNRSWNCGVEGETDRLDVVALRRRQLRNLLSTLLLSTGVPLLVAGDEMGRTQGGNNNAYCQDNEVSWVDWSLREQWSWLPALVRDLLALRRAHPVLRARHFFVGEPSVDGGRKDLAWFAPDGQEMTDGWWWDTSLATLGMFLAGDGLRSRGMRGEPLVDDSFLLWLHAGPTELDVTLPAEQWAGSYEVVLDTALESAVPPVAAHVDAGSPLRLHPRSVLLLRAAR